MKLNNIIPFMPKSRTLNWEFNIFAIINAENMLNLRTSLLEKKISDQMYFVCHNYFKGIISSEADSIAVPK